MTGNNSKVKPHRTPVPVVDFAQFLHGTTIEQKNAATAIDDAFQAFGVVYLSNHGVPKERVDECLAWSKRFFDLPYEEKMKAPHPPGHTHHRGYSGLGRERASQKVFDKEELAKLREASQDVKESFESGNTTDELQPNIWPPEEVIPGFRSFMESFFQDCASLVHSILTCLGHALSLPDPASLSEAHSSSPFQLRILHYPPVSLSALRAGASRINAHSDFGSLTLLFQDHVGGLEIQDLDTSDAPATKSPGEGDAGFHPVEPQEGCVLVNVGDLMERWSNARWRSPVHRVGSPGTISHSANSHTTASSDSEGGFEEMSPARYSIPFFAAPNMDARIEPLPGCFDEKNPPRWSPTTTMGYVQMRMAAIYPE